MLDFISEKQDCWEFLQDTELPVFIYGMGDGALKIMKVFEEYGIPVAGFFASDEFVRGHTFEGHLVHTLSQIESLIDDFVIVLAFAAGYKSLYVRINALAERHTLVAPDVPIAGDGIFTYRYCLENAEKIQAVYDMLADDISRRTYADVINFRISGKIKYLNDCTSPREEVYESLIPLSENDVFVDMGAYRGDTVEEFISASGGTYKRIYAFEPNPKNFRRLSENFSGNENIILLNAAAGSKKDIVRISAGEGRMAHLSSSGKTVEIPVITADEAVPEQASVIKIDVEGDERQALTGSRKHISGGAKILCSLYHRNEDIFELPLLIKEMSPCREFYIRHHLYIPAWETNLYVK